MGKNTNMCYVNICNSNQKNLKLFILMELTGILESDKTQSLICRNFSFKISYLDDISFFSTKFH